MDLRSLFEDAAREANTLISDLPAEAIGRPTPGTEWTVRDLINHMVATVTAIGGARERGSLSSAELTELMGSDLIGDDPDAAWRAATDRLTAAFRPEAVTGPHRLEAVTTARAGTEGLGPGRGWAIRAVCGADRGRPTRPSRSG
jgi:uncharacterized protein (TIGR03086 family)